VQIQESPIINPRQSDPSENEPRWGARSPRTGCRCWCPAARCRRCCAPGRMGRRRRRRGALGRRWRSVAGCRASGGEPTWSSSWAAARTTAAPAERERERERERQKPLSWAFERIFSDYALNKLEWALSRAHSFVHHKIGHWIMNILALVACQLDKIDRTMVKRRFWPFLDLDLWPDRSQNLIKWSPDNNQFTSFCVAQYHKLQIRLRGLYNLDTYFYILDLWPHIGSGRTPPKIEKKLFHGEKEWRTLQGRTEEDPSPGWTEE